MRIRVARATALVIAGALGLFLCGRAFAVLTLEQLRPGMRGYGKTVISGATITRFDVRIVDIMRSDGATGDFLFIKVGGPEIEAAGGISAGMSGSPIYVDDNLVGAVAYTTEYSDTLYGYATPIEYMLPLLEDAKAARLPEEGPLGALGRCNSPVMVSGLSRRGFLRLAERLSGYGLRAVQGGGSAERADLSEAKLIEPGGSIGIQLIRGAVNVTALGTMTYIQGDRFIGFGHSFIHNGRSDFPLVRTVVHQSIRSSQLPFRVGSPAGPIAGTVTQDRQAGVGGALGRKPKLVGLTVKLSGDHLARPRSLECELARDPVLTPELAGIAVLGLVEAVVDRVGGGSASYEMRLEVPGGKTVTRKDVVQDAEDLAGQIGLEVQDILLAVAANPVAPAEASQADLSIECSLDPAEAEIVGLTVTPQVVAPGGEADVSVVIKPFRKPEEIRRLRVRIPKDASSPLLRLRVHGKTAGELLKYDAWDADVPPGSLDEVLESIGRDGRRCCIVCDLAVSPLERLFAPQFGLALPLLEGPTTELRDLPERQRPPQDPAARQLLALWTVLSRETQETPYVVKGERTALIQIARDRAPGGAGG